MDPNKTGRAFEAIVLEYLIQSLKTEDINAKYTSRALEIQKGYISIFNELADLAKGDVKYKKLHENFISTTPQLVDWIINSFKLKSCEIVIIDKFKDSEASGNIADLQLQVFYNGEPKVINLSLKNNHDALKHSRVGPLPTWIGFSKEDDEYIEYTKKLVDAREKVKNKISNLSQSKNTPIKNYKDLDLINTNVKRYSTHYKNQHIYPEFYSVIKDFMETQAQNKRAVNLLFRYLMSEPHYKIINLPKEFRIYDFTSIPDASSVTFNIDLKNGYLMLNFDNGFKMAIRLHNDKSEILKSFNYKCDINLVSLDELNITPFILKK
ncbi:hypothetical protein C6Y01_17195 [Bacillus sp. NMCC46]|uniref:HaeIII family restriction endonuclease n=2 Tax=Bacillus TaxID=1386 RepID=UPI000D03D38C|nr:HaeIII family restriction endonuclease [Bacillus sp. NMCC46]PRS38361.1 hypothetical protein C6Y01_17195 [Bacillus sp. NMCC46]